MNQKLRVRKRKTKAAVVHDVATCENAIFDETYGEYKCKVLKHRIQDSEKYCTGCKDYKKKKGEKDVR